MAEDLPDDFGMHFELDHHARLHKLRLIISSARELQQGWEIASGTPATALSPDAAILRDQTLGTVERQFGQIAAVQWGAGLEAEFVIAGLRQMLRTCKALFAGGNPAVRAQQLDAVDRATYEIMRIIAALSIEKGGA